MQFLNEIRGHLANFETEASDEIHKFIDWLHTKYQETGAPVVSLPNETVVTPEPTFIPAVDNVPVESPVEVIVEAPIEAPVETAVVNP
jgi:hypothetical protein